MSPEHIDAGVGNFIDPETRDMWKDMIPLGRQGDAKELKGAGVCVPGQRRELMFDSGGYCY